jgi:hypothetical protein
MFDTIKNITTALKETYKIAHDVRLTNKQNKLQTKIDKIEAKKYFNHKSIIPSTVQQEQEVKEEITKSKRQMQKSMTLFISPTNAQKNRLAILNLFKKDELSVKVSVHSTHGKDYQVNQEKGQNADNFNIIAEKHKAKLENYGVNFKTWNRKYNQGGKTLD